MILLSSALRLRFRLVSPVPSDQGEKSGVPIQHSSIQGVVSSGSVNPPLLGRLEQRVGQVCLEVDVDKERGHPYTEPQASNALSGPEAEE